MFEKLASAITARTGVELTRGGLRDALELHYKKRLHELELGGFEDYLNLVQTGDAQELERIVDIVSVPHTWFFRDAEQLHVVGELITELGRQAKVVNIWIPGCASGEDVYSVALIAASLGVNTRITGSDLCARSLSIARRGLYSAFSLRALPPEFRDHFRRIGHQFEIAPDIKRQTSFEHHNLLEPALAINGGWHLILCRNVFIYFSKETSQKCAARLGQKLHESGFALFGAGELIGSVPCGLESYTLRNRVLFRKLRQPDTRVLQSAPRPPVSEFNLAKATPAPIEIASPKLSLARESTPELAETAERLIDPHARMMTGIALYSSGDLDRSLHELRAASLLDERLWLAAVFQGMCLESMGLPDLARAEYRHVVRLLETNPSYRSNLPLELEGFGPELLELAKAKSA